MRKIRSKELLSLDELAEIGSIALESTECEVVVGRMLWHLANMDEQVGAHFTHSMSISTRLDLLRSLGAERLPPAGPEKAELDAIIDGLKQLNSERNHAIHGSWGAWYTLRDLMLLPSKGKLMAKARKTAKPGKTPTEKPASFVVGLPERIAGATDRLIAFANRHWPKPSL